MRKNKTEKKQTSIGGQAVLEGVMMRGTQSMATAVRDGDGIIRVESKRLVPVKKRNLFFRLPIIRGVCSFIDSLFGGTKVLMRSAEVFGEGEPSKFEKWISEKLKVNVMGVVSTLSLILGLALAVLLFMWLPQTVRFGIEKLVGNGFSFGIWAKNFIEGGLKLIVFICYILLVSLMKDIKRTFMYHGAEHKTISCYENGLELTVENVRKCSRVHDRCGTTFMVFVMLISIIVFACVEALIGVSVERVWRILLKIALLPIVAGLSYELLKGLAKTKSRIFFPLKLPGLLLQKITTREPDDGMIEVAVKAFETVIAMDEDETIPETEFIVPMRVCDLTVKISEKLNSCGIDESAEAEWIVSIALGIKRDEVNGTFTVQPKQIDKVYSLADERCSGRPLWYCVGDTNFYGYTIKVDERVLIPRPETELLVENALKVINKDSTVLDLCAGSGAIAIAIKKQSGARVTAIDVSVDALTLAKDNAILNDADIEFIESDLFSTIDGDDRKFDVIVTNPPYIKTDDIKTLQKEVKDFEPILALDGGKDGYDFYKIIVSNAKKHLNDGGVILLECGIGQAKTVAEMFNGFNNVEIIKDYENIDRIVKAVL